MNLKELPPELLDLTFQYLDGITLLRLKKVDKYLCNIIDNSITLVKIYEDEVNRRINKAKIIKYNNKIIKMNNLEAKERMIKMDNEKEIEIKIKKEKWKKERLQLLYTTKLYF